MLQYFVLGLIQGIFEWLPVSSEAMIVLAQNAWFGELGLENTVRLALFLHLGTVMAAIVYFYDDIWSLVKTVFQYRHAKLEDKVLFWFLVATTATTAIVGLGVLELLKRLDSNNLTGRALLFGILLLITAVAQLRRTVPEHGRSSSEATIPDGLLLGVVQGLAGLPGLSRSGSTVAVLLFRKFSDVAALRLSFLASIPAVIGGNILLNRDYFSFGGAEIVGLLAAFVGGLATIHIMLLVARKISIGYFVLIFAVLVLAASFV
jgi:undecaprenyl-diphosphatase